MPAHCVHGRLWCDLRCKADFNLQLQTNSKAESPTIDCSGQNGIILYFSYFQNADDPTGNDDVSVEYFDGTTWTTIADPPQTDPGCGQGFGMWTQYAVALGASADNNPNVKISLHGLMTKVAWV